MKRIFALLTSLSLVLFSSFRPVEETVDAVNINGVWKVQIDKQIDGQFSGDQGCSSIKIKKIRRATIYRCLPKM